MKQYLFFVKKLSTIFNLYYKKPINTIYLLAFITETYLHYYLLTQIAPLT